MNSADHDALGRLPIHYAALEGRVDELLKLLREGAEVDVRDRKGDTPLLFAAQQDQVACVEALVASGAAVDAADANGNTPLLRAMAGGGSIRTAEVLLRAGANVDTRNSWGTSARELAGSLADSTFAKAIERRDRR